MLSLSCLEFNPGRPDRRLFSILTGLPLFTCLQVRLPEEKHTPHEVKIFASSFQHLKARKERRRLKNLLHKILSLGVLGYDSSTTRSD
jgi:hypothetical protein